MTPESLHLEILVFTLERVLHANTCDPHDFFLGVTNASSFGY